MILPLPKLHLCCTKFLSLSSVTSLLCSTTVLTVPTMLRVTMGGEKKYKCMKIGRAAIRQLPKLIGEIMHQISSVWKYISLAGALPLLTGGDTSLKYN